MSFLVCDSDQGPAADLVCSKAANTSCISPSPRSFYLPLLVADLCTLAGLFAVSRRCTLQRESCAVRHFEPAFELTDMLIPSHLVALLAVCFTAI